MAIPSRTVKGLHDIRSYSGRAREEAAPHKAYMRLSCLEMEKFRRAKERESAMARVRNIDTRFREIDSEEALILLAGGGTRLRCPPLPGSAPLPDSSLPGQSLPTCRSSAQSLATMAGGRGGLPPATAERLIFKY